MKSTICVLSMIGFLSACAGTEARLDAAAEAQGQLEAAREIPEWPERCRQIIRSGVRTGDRLDVAVLKTDAALVRQQELARVCARWYDDLRRGLRDDTPEDID